MGRYRQLEFSASVRASSTRLGVEGLQEKRNPLPGWKGVPRGTPGGGKAESGRRQGVASTSGPSFASFLRWAR